MKFIRYTQHNMGIILISNFLNNLFSVAASTGASGSPFSNVTFSYCWGGVSTGGFSETSLLEALLSEDILGRALGEKVVE